MKYENMFETEADKLAAIASIAATLPHKPTEFMDQGKYEIAAPVYDTLKYLQEQIRKLGVEDPLAEKAEKVLKQYHAASEQGGTCILTDADTVLEDVLYERERVPDVAEELIGIWKDSTDRASVEALFASITGVTFEEYLDRCLKEPYEPSALPASKDEPNQGWSEPADDEDAEKESDEEGVNNG